MAAWQIAERHHLAKPVVEQPEYNLFHRKRVESEYRHLYHDIGLGLTTWSPLASGLLTGKYRAGVPGDSRGAIPRMKFLLPDLTDAGKNATVGELEFVAKELGCTLAQLAIAWCLKHPHVSTVITGASRVEQVRENLKAVDVVPKLTAPVMEQIEKIVAGHCD
jgi:aryl-alcohol dehydrogenase-like predicted oxidoreductase